MKRFFAITCLASLASSSLVGSAEASRPPRPPGPRHVWASFKKPARAIDPAATREIQSELCATTERAEVNLRHQLEAAVSAWLAENGVDRSWTPPKPLVDRMVASKVYVEPVMVKDLNVFRASVSAEFSDRRKREFLNVYHRQVGWNRIVLLGGGLTFVLACLAAVSGYIRADEATKGYYTNRLRLLAAAGVGAAGVVVYQILT
ncbi:MAG: hypothetical protein JWN86_2170 [Planctomycetota bacterium]|nr:hypothetical protein [Planctomycetota bacterium]